MWIVELEMSLLTLAAPEIGKFVKFEYTGSFFRVVVEIFRLRPVLGRYRVAPGRRSELSRRKVLRKVICQIGETKTQN
jgi:hypothetical protein